MNKDLKELTEEIIREAEVLAMRTEVITKKSVFVMSRTSDGVLTSLKVEAQ